MRAPLRRCRALRARRACRHRLVRRITLHLRCRLLFLLPRLLVVPLLTLQIPPLPPRWRPPQPHPRHPQHGNRPTVSSVYSSSGTGCMPRSQACRPCGCCSMHGHCSCARRVLQRAQSSLIQRTRAERIPPPPSSCYPPSYKSPSCITSYRS